MLPLLVVYLKPALLMRQYLQRLIARSYAAVPRGQTATSFHRMPDLVGMFVAAFSSDDVGCTQWYFDHFLRRGLPSCSA